MSDRSDTQADWSELQNTLRENPPPMLFGPPRIVDGYYNLELLERGVRLQSLRAHRVETSLWYHGLKLLSEPMHGVWELPEDAQLRKMRGLQAEILGLEISSAKVGIDLILDGHYSIAMGAIRHMLEGFIQMFYIQCYPDRVKLWYSDAETPGCRQMVDQIKKYIRQATKTKDEIPKIEQVYESWKFMSKGSHPTGGGITQVQPTEDDPRHMVGSAYRPHLAYVGFDSGLYALDYMLDCIPILGRDSDEWHAEFQSWSAKVRKWRRTLLDVDLIQDQISDDIRQRYAGDHLEEGPVIDAREENG